MRGEAAALELDRNHVVIRLREDKPRLSRWPTGASIGAEIG
jgi:hypothetical protein